MGNMRSGLDRGSALKSLCSVCGTWTLSCRQRGVSKLQPAAQLATPVLYDQQAKNGSYDLK